MDHLEDSPCLALRLDLTSGDFFRSQVRYKFSTSVCPPPHNHGFSLVISFGRANFPLNIHNVGLAQSACLGDSHDAFVSHISEIGFSLSKSVQKILDSWSLVWDPTHAKILSISSIYGAMVARTGEERNRSGTWNKIMNGLLYITNLQELLAHSIKVIVADQMPIFIVALITLSIPSRSAVYGIIWKKFATIMSGSPKQMLTKIFQIFRWYNVPLSTQRLPILWIMILGPQGKTIVHMPHLVFAIDAYHMITKPTSARIRSDVAVVTTMDILCVHAYLNVTMPQSIGSNIILLWALLILHIFQR
jgi:hypothetical protein